MPSTAASHTYCHPFALSGVLLMGGGRVLGGETQAAVEHIVGKGDLARVVGYAGTGKAAMLGVGREAWEHQGYHVRGAALSGIAAENLEGGSAISSRTIASLEYQWDQGRDLLTNRDVLVIDGADRKRVV